MSVYIVAEIGINHNGSRDMALKLMKRASDCGANAVKLQKRHIGIVYSPEELEKPRASEFGMSTREQKEGIEFGSEDYNIFWAYAKSLGLDFFASAWDLESLEFLESYNPPLHKIASAMITHIEFVKAVADLGRHTFISTGMCEMENISKAVDIFRLANCKFTLLHCVALYPCREVKYLNLKMIQTLRDHFNCEVGYSGHEVGLSPSLAAVAMGATVIERHFTLDRSDFGSDHASSLEPTGLRRLVNSIREIETAMGDGVKCWAPGEREVAAKLRYFER